MIAAIFWMFTGLGLALLGAIVIAEVSNAKRTSCRCCKKPIKPGGHGFAGLGSGFCQRCITAILKGTQ